MSKKNNNNGNHKFSLHPKTNNQYEYLKAIKQYDIFFGLGPAGTGKTFCAIGYACQNLIDPQCNINKILIVRTIVNNGSTVGTLPGELKERTFYHFFQQNHYLKSMLSNLYPKYEKDIDLIPLELIRGHSYNDTFMILDEAQNATASQIKLFISRMGNGSKCCVIGDESQSDIGSKNGLVWCKENLNHCPSCIISKLTYNDIQRNKVIGPVMKIFDDKGI